MSNRLSKAEQNPPAAQAGAETVYEQGEHAERRERLSGKERAYRYYRIPGELIPLHGEFTYIEEILANRYPRTRTVTFDGDLDMKDGETAVLEGLITPQQAQEAVRQVPGRPAHPGQTVP